MTPFEYCQANSDPVTGAFTGSHVEWMELFAGEFKAIMSDSIAKQILRGSPNDIGKGLLEWSEYYDQQSKHGEGWLEQLDRLKNG